MSRITDLVANTSLATNDLLVVVDVSDTSMASTGTDKKLTVAQLLGFPANVSSTPADPASTVSTTLVMMGLGSSWAITPASSGKVLVNVTGGVTTATAVVNFFYTGRFGTGTAPLNGAAVSGTRFGAVEDAISAASAAGVYLPFAFTALVTLTPGTAYWFDLALSTTNAADAASFRALSFTAVEIA